MEAAGGRKAREDGAVSTIGVGVVITGEVTCSVDLQVDGRINGDVRCPTLLLSEDGMITGAIHAERVRISGRVDGAIETRDLALEATAYIDGDITYSRLKVAPGGKIRGRMQPRDDEPAMVEPAPLKLVDPSPLLTPQAIRVFGE